VNARRQAGLRVIFGYALWLGFLGLARLALRHSDVNDAVETTLNITLGLVGFISLVIFIRLLSHLERQYPENLP
jgi:hypothetical protein